MSTQRFTIELNFEYEAFHGLYPNEKKDGNIFSVDILLWMDAPKEKFITDIHQTVDYVEVFGVVKAIMDQPEDLLETVGARIVSALNLKYKQLNEIKVKLTKVTPPIDGYFGTVSVTCHETF